MDKIIGDIAGVPNPKSDWLQADERKADYIKNKPDLNVFSNALKGTKSGEAIGITDISPIEHNMGVKISGIDDISTVKLYKQGKNLLSNDVYEKSNWIYNAQGQSYTYNLQLSKGIYTISFDCVQQKGYFYLEYSTDDWETKKTIYLMTPNDLKQTHTFEVDGKTQWRLFWYFSSNWFADGYITNIQIELGTTPTEYEPYIEPTIYDVSADGTVEGVNTIYPNTTLYTDTQGAVIDVEYNRDINKAFAELQAMILEG